MKLICFPSFFSFSSNPKPSKTTLSTMFILGTNMKLFFACNSHIFNFLSWGFFCIFWGKWEVLWFFGGTVLGRYFGILARDRFWCNSHWPPWKWSLMVFWVIIEVSTSLKMSLAPLSKGLYMPFLYFVRPVWNHTTQ